MGSTSVGAPGNLGCPADLVRGCLHTVVNRGKDLIHRIPLVGVRVECGTVPADSDLPLVTSSFIVDQQRGMPVGPRLFV